MIFSAKKLIYEYAALTFSLFIRPLNFLFQNSLYYWYFYYTFYRVFRVLISAWFVLWPCSRNIWITDDRVHMWKKYNQQTSILYKLIDDLLAKTCRGVGCERRWLPPSVAWQTNERRKLSSVSCYRLILLSWQRSAVSRSISYSRRFSTIYRFLL